MDDEFDKLIKYFDAEVGGKEKNLEGIFQKSMEFFEKYKHVLSEGDEEEKIAMKKKMDILRGRLREENKKSQARLNMSEEEIKQLSSDPKYFTPSQWEFLTTAQKEMQQEKERHEIKIKTAKEERQKELRGKRMRKTTLKKSDWMKS
jgi:hypothetical protein